MLQTILFTIMMLHICSFQQQPCQCFHILDQSVCFVSKACLWEEGRCTNNPNYSNSMENQCQSYSKVECFLVPNCAYYQDKCILFTSCDIFSASECNTSQNNCISDGINCVPKTFCQNYQNQSACNNQDKDGGYCRWDQKQDIKCQLIQNCSELPVMHSHSLCENALASCTLGVEGKCVEKFIDCSEYQAFQCFSTLDNKACFWNIETKLCLEKKCENAFYATDTECTIFIPNCTTNGFHCIVRGLCSQMPHQNGCIVDNLGNQCYWTGTQCAERKCSEIPSSENCISYFSDLNCVPTASGGCKTKPQDCNFFETQNSCLFDFELNECVWQNSQCQLKLCSNAPQFSDCVMWKQDNSCTADISGFCLDLPESCSEITNMAYCYKNKAGESCQYFSCTEAYCSKAPQTYSTHNQCEQWNIDCTVNLSNGGCMQKSNLCSDYQAEEQCHSTKQRENCIYDNGQCIQKLCSLGVFTTNQDCQIWGKGCIINQGQNGCTDWPSYCNGLITVDQCYLGLNTGIYCEWNGTMCIDQQNNNVCSTAQNANQFDQHEECNRWDGKCTVLPKVYGCAARLNCENYLTEHQCVIGIDEQQCSWISGQCLNICSTFSTETAKVSDCESHNASCTVNFFAAKCIQKTYCSAYKNKLDCKINHSDQPCKWNGTDQVCQDVVCEDNTTAVTENECSYFLNYQQCYNDGIGCITRTLDCDDITNPILCNNTIPRCKTNYCYYTNGCCMEILANKCESIIDATSNEDCQKYNKECILNTISGIGCINLISCSQIQDVAICNAITGLIFLPSGEQCIYSHGSCHSKFQCDGFSTNCTTVTIYQVKCKFSNGAMCTELLCSDFTGIANNANCQAHQSFCYYNGTSCKTALQCSIYSTLTICNSGKTIDNQYCQWIGGVCQKISCSSIGYPCLYFNNQCIWAGGSCVDIVSCTQIILETDCYLSYNIQNLKCLWINSQCQDYYNCTDIITTSFTEYQCTRYDLCRLSKTSPGCEFKQCNEYTQMEYCNMLSQCQWNSGSCKDKTECQFQLNQTDCQNNINCFWNTVTCQYQQCNTAMTISTCGQVQLKSGNKCLWYNSICTESYQCAQIRNPRFFDDCNIQHKNCVIQYVFSDKQHYCKTKSFSCNLITNVYQCVSDIHNNQCLWDSASSSCIYNQCQQYTITSGIYSNLICEQFDKLCVANSTNTGCRTRMNSCNLYTTQSSCTYALITGNTYCFWNGALCIDATCSNYSLLVIPEIPCQQYAKCSVIGGVCVNRLVNCNLYLSQSECQTSFDLSGKECAWLNASCQAKSCSNYPHNIYAHNACNSWLSTCTVNAELSSCILILSCLTAPTEIDTILKCQTFVSPTLEVCTIGYYLGGCQNLPSSCNLATITQCFIDVNRNICYWSKQYSVCKQLTCSNIDTTVTTATSCELLLSDCTIALTGQGCQTKLNCLSYSSSQCQLPGIKNNNQNNCTFGCQQSVCEDYQYQTDTSCKSILGGKCITNGQECITPITCSDFSFNSQCQISREGKLCFWIADSNLCVEKKCTQANSYYNTHYLCQQFMNTCTYNFSSNSCVEMDSCSKFDNSESCLIDKFGNSCIWHDSQCSDSTCMNTCGDGVVNLVIEQCDDGNLLPNDGCYNCQYSCVIGCLLCESGICNQCDYGQGYYLNENNVCLTKCGDEIISGQEQCDDGNQEQYDGCFSCQYQCHWACIQCQQGSCYECQFGYSISSIDQCELICGDGIVVVSSDSSSEQCDDANIDSFDGCSEFCTVETQWDCYNDQYSPSECQFAKQPEMILSLITTAPSLYQQVLVTFQDKLQIVKALSGQVISANVLFLDPFAYNIKIANSFQPSTDFIEVEYLISIEFKQSVENPQLFIKFDPQFFMNEHHQNPTHTQQSLRLFTTYFESSSQQQISSTSQIFNTILLYILLAIAIISIVTGNLEMFWNLLDLVQYLSYLKYINIQFPNNLNAFFNLFNVITLQPFLDFIHFQAIINLFSKNEDIIIETTNKFYQDNINAFYFYNFASTMLIFGTTFATYYGSVFMVKLISKYMRLFYFKQNLLKLIEIIFRELIKFVIYFYYSGIIRIFLTNAYDILFTVLLQLYYPQFDSFIKGFSVVISIFSLSFMMMIIYFILSKQTSSCSQNDGLQVLNEGVDSHSGIWTRQFNSLLLIKKLSFMLMLIFMQKSGALQTTLISITHTSFVLYLIQKRPITNDNEYYKTIFVETQIGFATSIFIAYDLPIFTLDQKYNIGWAHIGIFTSILTFTVIIDFTSRLKALRDKFIKICRGKIDNQKIVIFENVRMQRKQFQQFRF